MSTVTRKVRFNVILETPEDGKHSVWVDFPGERVSEIINELGVGDNGRFARADGQYVIGHPVESSDGTALCLYRVSTHDYPMLFNRNTNELRPLSELLNDPEIEIANPTYFVIFDDGVVGHIFNQVGPRPKDLELYLERACQLKVELRPVPRVDVLGVLQQSAGVKVLQYKLPRVPGVAPGDNEPLNLGFRLLEIFPGSDVEIIVRARGAGIRQNLARGATDLMGSMLDHREMLKKLRVELERGEDISGGALDLLEDFLAVEQSVKTVTGSRYLESENAIATIIATRKDVQDLITSGINALVKAQT